MQSQVTADIDPYISVRAHLIGRKAAETMQSRREWFQALARSGFTGILTGDYAGGIQGLLTAAEILGGYRAPLSLAPAAGGAAVLAASGTARAKALLASVLSGGAPVLPALQSLAGTKAMGADGGLKAEPGAKDGILVSGNLIAVPDAQEAQAFLAEAEGPDGIIVFLFEPSASGPHFHQMQSASGGILGAFEFDQAPVATDAVVARGEAAHDLVDRMGFAVQLGLSAELAGLGAALMTRAGAAHASERDIADALMDVSLARAFVFGAAGMAQPGRPDAMEMIAGARAAASEAALGAARLALSATGDDVQRAGVERLALRALVASRIYSPPQAHKLRFVNWRWGAGEDGGVFGALFEAASLFAGGGKDARMSQPVADLIDLNRQVRSRAIKSGVADDPVFRDRLCSVEIEMMALACADAQQQSGGLVSADLVAAAVRRIPQRLADCALHAAGTHAAIADGDDRCGSEFLQAYSGK